MQNITRIFSNGKLETWTLKNCKRCGRFISNTQDKYCTRCGPIVKKECSRINQRKLRNTLKSNYKIV
jgi:ribosomal protein L37E